MDTLINIAVNHVLIKDMSKLLDFDLINREFDKLSLTKNAYNNISVDRHFFDQEIFKDTKNTLTQECIAYLKNTNQSTEFESLKMTESWGNVTKPGEGHHKHGHPFSVVSGVIYLDDNPDNLLLNLEQYLQDVPYYIPVQFVSVSLERLVQGQEKQSNNLKNHLVLFLSNVEHFVEITRNNTQNRRSISFNTFWQGSVGDASPGSLGSMIF
jgi:uncharacterized protein (TIGR02466 family)